MLSSSVMRGGVPSSQPKSHQNQENISAVLFSDHIGDRIDTIKPNLFHFNLPIYSSFRRSSVTTVDSAVLGAPISPSFFYFFFTFFTHQGCCFSTAPLRKESFLITAVVSPAPPSSLQSSRDGTHPGGTPFLPDHARAESLPPSSSCDTTIAVFNLSTLLPTHFGHRRMISTAPIDLSWGASQ